MNMRKRNDGAVSRFANWLAWLTKRDEFTCGDCERWERCGLVSSDRCIIKAGQIASGDWKSRRRISALNRAIGA